MNDSRTRAPGDPGEPGLRTGRTRGPWAVLRAVVTVVLGPAAATASALDQADAAPPHPAARADRTHPSLPSDASRRRAA
jgi:hypothetical protein